MTVLVLSHGPYESIAPLWVYVGSSPHVLLKLHEIFPQVFFSAQKRKHWHTAFNWRLNDDDVVGSSSYFISASGSSNKGKRKPESRLKFFLHWCWLKEGIVSNSTEGSPISRPHGAKYHRRFKVEISCLTQQSGKITRPRHFKIALPRWWMNYSTNQYLTKLEIRLSNITLRTVGTDCHKQ